MKIKLRKIIYAFVFFLLLFSLLYSRREKESNFRELFNYKGYNIVLISLGPLRADHLGCYGYSRNTSPNTDRLARRSLIFKNNHSQSSITLSSQMSLFTSMYPHEHRVFSPLESTSLNRKTSTLTQILKENGYKTVWIGPLDNPWVDISRGAGRGFDEKYSHLPDTAFFELPEGRKDIAWDNAFAWIKNKDNRHKKFFMALYTDRVHSPYFASDESILMFADKISEAIPNSYKKLFQKTIKRIVSSPSLIFLESSIGKNKHLFLQQYDIDNLKGQDYQDIMSRFKELQADCLQSLPMLFDRIFWESIDTSNKSDMEYVKALYDAEIYEMDETLGILIEELENSGLLEKTVIVITSDHGEEFLEHGSIEHGGNLYEEATHIPLIIFLPKNGGYLEVNELVQSIDLMPTVLDLVNIKIPDYARGISLLPLMKQDKHVFFGRYIYAQAQNDKISCRFKDWKYISDLDMDGESYVLNGKNEELYDLSSDPQEKTNLIGVKSETAKQLKEKIEVLLSGKSKDHIPH